MSFNLIKTQKIANPQADYKHIAQQFCLEYYTLYDENVENLGKMYYSESLFLYLDNEITGFNNWINALKQNNYNKFTHHNMNVSAIPINDTNLQVTIYGTLTLNNNMIENKFVENILLQRDNNNTFYICTTLFKFID
jgi:hypothetical protein